MKGNDMLTVQNRFLSYLIENKTPVMIFLMAGVKLQGVIIDSDADGILVDYNNRVQFIYKQAISTITPAHPIDDWK